MPYVCHFNQLRLAHGLKTGTGKRVTLAEIKKATGLSNDTLTLFSHGTVDDVRLSSVLKLCAFFGLKSVAELIEYVPDEP